jgi:uncharacterized protein YqfA (UPF0365 family)
MPHARRQGKPCPTRGRSHYNATALERIHMIELVFIALLIIAGLIFLIMLAIIGQYLALWFQTVLTGCPIPFLDLILMRYMKVDPRVIAVNYINARKAGLDVTIEDLKTHFLAGGRVTNTVRGLIIAKNADIELDWTEATKLDLAGHDLYAEMMKTATEKRKA